MNARKTTVSTIVRQDVQKVLESLSEVERQCFLTRYWPQRLSAHQRRCAARLTRFDEIVAQAQSKMVARLGANPFSVPIQLKLPGLGG